MAKKKRTNHKTNYSQAQKRSEELENYVLYGHRLRTILECERYSDYQNFLYKRAMLGLEIYEPWELKHMHPEKKIRIQRTKAKTQTVINLWKQELINNFTNAIFRLFSNSQTAKRLLKESFVDSAYESTLKPYQLGITKDAIIRKLYEEGILPTNFYELDKPKVKPLNQQDYAR